MFTQVLVWLNAVANTLAVCLAPIAWLPGWLSATLIGAITGVVMLLVFKLTSNQRAIKRVRSQIKANLLAVSLFKEDLGVVLRSQGRIVIGAMQLAALALVPMAVMIVPTVLLLGQLALWYQARPIAPGETAVVTVSLAENVNDTVWDNIELKPNNDFLVEVGPVRVPSKQWVCWDVKPLRPGCHMLEFEVGDEIYRKEICSGSGYCVVSMKRPAWNWNDVLLHPRERPFPANSPVQSIEITYPARKSWTAGSDWWLVYWFGISMVAAFAARPLLGVHI